MNIAVRGLESYARLINQLERYLTNHIVSFSCSLASHGSKLPAFRRECGGVGQFWTVPGAH